MELTQEQINNLYEAINGIAGLVLMLKGISNSSVDDEALICSSILTCVIDVRKKIHNGVDLELVLNKGADSGFAGVI